MKKSKILICALVAVLALALAIACGAQGTKEVEKGPEGLPKEVSIADSKKQAVEVLQIRVDNVGLRQEALINKFRATPEWTALEAEGKLLTTQLQDEYKAALKAAGLTESDFQKYTYDQKALKFTLRPSPTAPPEPPAYQATPAPAPASTPKPN